MSKVLTMVLRCVVAFLAVTCSQAQNQYQNEDGNFQNNQDSMQPQFPTSNNNQRGGPGVNFQSDFRNALVEQRGRLAKVIEDRNGVIEEHIYLKVGKNKPHYIDIESLFSRYINTDKKGPSVKHSPGQNEEFNSSSNALDLFDILDEENSGGEATTPTLLYITLALIICRMHI
ncbi:uncharacterized protein LOC111000953 [Pieris rapae]|uniref:uncharacterized protein LOC111000953 n=1 Tax=Pieris rapae TaxID=64459 RepID=UPI001E27B33F|nr:uncharacterized protein LOC111000953 [Pieris rapae]